MLRWCHAALSLALLALFVARVQAGWPPSSSSGLSDCSQDIQVGPSTPYRVIAAADWNNNQKVDIVAVDAMDASQLQVWEWDSDAHQFKWLATQALPGSIVTGTAIDVNRDGRVDVIVTLDTSYVYVVLQNASGFPSQPALLTANQLVPMSVNLINIYDACARPWVYGVDAATGFGTLTTINVGADRGGCNFDSVVTTTPSNASYALLRYPTGFSAAADLTGDCLAEAIFASFVGEGSSRTQFWSIPSANPSTFSLNSSSTPAARPLFQVPSSFGSPSIADWNGDGTADFLFPACLGADLRPVEGCSQHNFLVLVPNTATGLCDGDDCCSETGAHFDSIEASTQINATQGARYFNLSLCHNPTTRLNISVVIRDGDYNDDGVVDAAAASSSGPIYLTGRTDAQFFDCQALTIQSTTSNAMTSLPQTADPFFFDIDDDGRLDLLTTVSEPAAAKRSGGGVYAFWSDAATIGNYYLTAMTINGASVGGGTAWGANIVGATHRFQYIDINQNTHVASSTQATTTGGNALRQPRAHFGLAVTFSYISNYATGYARDGSVAKRQWPVYLMPNSQVVVVANPASDPDDWALKLFLYGQRFMQLVLIGWLASLGIVGLPMSIMKLRELQNDRRELHRHD